MIDQKVTSNLTNRWCNYKAVRNGSRGQPHDPSLHSRQGHWGRAGEELSAFLVLWGGCYSTPSFPSPQWHLWLPLQDSWSLWQPVPPLQSHIKKLFPASHFYPHIKQKGSFPFPLVMTPCLSGGGFSVSFRRRREGDSHLTSLKSLVSGQMHVDVGKCFKVNPCSQ